jgi:ATP-dependent protease Clp ATPase subunit
MEVFAYNAAKPREELASFNHRVAVFCKENMVVQAKASMVGPTLLLSLTLADDIEVPVANTITTHIEEVDGLADDLEDQLTRALEAISEADTESDPSIAFAMETVYRTDLPVRGFAVFQIINGAVVADDDAGEDAEE